MKLLSVIIKYPDGTELGVDVEFDGYVLRQQAGRLQAKFVERNLETISGQISQKQRCIEPAAGAEPFYILYRMMKKKDARCADAALPEFSQQLHSSATRLSGNRA